MNLFPLKLVWNWRDAWKWASIQIAAVAAGLQLALVGFPDIMRNYLPDWLTHWVAIVCFGAIALARITAIKEKTDVPVKPD